MTDSETESVIAQWSEPGATGTRHRITAHEEPGSWLITHQTKRNSYSSEWRVRDTWRAESMPEVDV